MSASTEVLSSLSYEDILAASSRIKTYSVRTPLLESEALNQRMGGRILIKAECLQRTGSFKFRGAFNFIQQLDEGHRQKGVVAYSSGNHAQAVAAAAALLNIPATIVMPADAPMIKIEGTRFYGATVVLYNRLKESREQIAQVIAQEKGVILIPPYDHPYTMAGQGTVGLEMIEQANEMGVAIESLLVPCSGGGLVAGVSTAVKALSPITSVYSVEPQGFDDTVCSLNAGTRLSNVSGAETICDALMMPQPGELTFPINQKNLMGGLMVTDEEVMQAMALAFQYLKLVIEPGGAVGLAAALTGKIETTGKVLAVVASGGNVDPILFTEVLNRFVYFP